jgi:hypothetical protein
MPLTMPTEALTPEGRALVSSKGVTSAFRQLSMSVLGPSHLGVSFASSHGYHAHAASRYRRFSRHCALSILNASKPRAVC